MIRTISLLVLLAAVVFSTVLAGCASTTPGSAAGQAHKLNDKGGWAAR